MGGIGKLLSFVRQTRNGASVSDAATDPGGGPNVTAEHFAAPGDDSHPLPDDFVLLVPLRQSGRTAAAGYLDPKNSQAAAPGERRLYARDSDGNVVATVWVKNTGEATLFNDNGSVTLRPDGGTITESPGATFDVAADGTVSGDNGAGFFTLEAGGNVNINNVVITPAGAITTPVGITTPSAVVNGTEVDAHDHPQGPDSAGNSEQDTGPMK